MNKKDIWVIFYISSLFIFLAYSFIYLDDYKYDRSYYSYSDIIRYLDDQVTALPYGVDEENASEFQALKNGINSLDENIDDSMEYLKQAYKDKYYSYEEYMTLKKDFEFSKTQLEKTKDTLDDKLK